jgi:hypothetical protein
VRAFWRVPLFVVLEVFDGIPEYPCADMLLWEYQAHSLSVGTLDGALADVENDLLVEVEYLTAQLCVGGGQCTSTRRRAGHLMRVNCGAVCLAEAACRQERGRWARQRLGVESGRDGRPRSGPPRRAYRIARSNTARKPTGSSRWTAWEAPGCSTTSTPGWILARYSDGLR